jgi:hypothetical protein
MIMMLAPVALTLYHKSVDSYAFGILIPYKGLGGIFPKRSGMEPNINTTPLKKKVSTDHGHFHDYPASTGAWSSQNTLLRQRALDS